MKNNLILSGEATMVNQILPHTNKWAFDLFLKGCANNWMPTEIPMHTDAQQWRSSASLTSDERLLLKRCLGFFAGSESLVSNNLLMNVFKYITDAECRQYILRQSFEESLHNLTIVYICDSLGLEIDEVYDAYQTIPSIKAKDDFLMKITRDINREGFGADGLSLYEKREVLRNLITYYVICEGIMFYSGFAMLLSFGKQNKLNGISEQIQYSLRDETLHIEFGITLINKIREQNPKIWRDDFEEQTLAHINEACKLEIAYAFDVLPRGILGLNADMFVSYMKYIANRRLEQLRMPKAYDEVANPFPWLSEVIDLPKLKNFFESRVTEYRSGDLVDDI